MRTIAGTTWPVEDVRAYIKARIKVDDNGCWIWQRAIAPNGYGRLSTPPRFWDKSRGTSIAHRAAFEAFVGPVHAQHDVCHRCDVRACCNPDHLWLGTRAENMRDAMAKSRLPRGVEKPFAKLTDDDVRAIRAADGTQSEIARRFGIDQSGVSEIRSRKRWAHVT